VILGLSMLTVTHLKAEGFWLGWLPYFRITLLTVGSLASLWMVWCLTKQASLGWGRRTAIQISMTFPVGLMVTVWSLVFFVW